MTDKKIVIKGRQNGMRSGLQADVLIKDDIQEELNDTSKLSESELVVMDNYNSVDFVSDTRARLIALPEHANLGHLSHLFCMLEGMLNRYDAAAEANQLNVLALTETKANDQDLQKVGATYNMTMNQTVAYMDMCDQVNANMVGTGIVAVPFWFFKQYEELQAQNKALIEEAEAVLLMVNHLQKQSQMKGGVEELGIELPSRTSIITGRTTPYIAGVNAPRKGDEHLDSDYTYNKPFNPRKR